jgi:transposase InsO family protein
MSKPLRIALRERVAAFVDEGASNREASRHFRVSPRFVNNLMKLPAEAGSLAPRRQGRGPGGGKLAAHVDTFSRYVPVLDPRFSNRAEDVVGVLEQVCPKIGYPKTIRVDQGSEFISRDLDLWAYAKGVTLDFSRSGKPNRQRLYRSLQWSLPSGVFERPLVPDACRCGRKDGGLAQILRRSPPAWGDRAQGADLVDQSRWRNQPAIVKGPGNSTFRRSNGWVQSNLSTNTASRVAKPGSGSCRAVTHPRPRS